MNLIEAIRTGKPFRRSCWVEPEDELQWCKISDDCVFDQCNILWIDGSTFGDITLDMLYQDDFEIRIK